MHSKTIFAKALVIVGVMLLSVSFWLMPMSMAFADDGGGDTGQAQECDPFQDSCAAATNGCSGDPPGLGCVSRDCNQSGTPAHCKANCHCVNTQNTCHCFP
jgi:hypothetical protein